jgi:uncharacterized radical SAM protein YgiQ
MKDMKLLPTNKQEMKERGWGACDIIFITGDAYCDHPSFGVALLSRFLESHGYKVGIIAQPDWRRDDDFSKLGSPRLFFGITAGNLDSMLNIYTSHMNLRKQDKYSTGGIAGLRPKLPTIVYSNKARQLFPGVPVVIGGIEASLRRLAHYDFWSDKVKRSILFDSKADILVYGMGERQVLDIARYLDRGEKSSAINDIRGTVIARADISFLKGPVVLPSFEEVAADKQRFLEAFKLYSGELNPLTAKPVVQKMDARYCIQLPCALPLNTQELDTLYGLKFTRKCHASYDKFGGVPALHTVATSLVSHRGCVASCSFCSLSLHQGRIVSSRSIDSLAREAQEIASQKDFKGVISDVGGPTANMYALECSVGSKCLRPDCLWPEICKNLKQDCQAQIKMLKCLRSVKNIKQVNIQSGVRFDLLMQPQASQYFKELCRYHVSGQLKIAPEHVADKVLRLMHKPGIKLYEKFLKVYKAINEELGKDQFLAQYFITAHPGCDESDALALARFTRGLGYTPEQIQDFIPLPMTASSVMYYTGLDPETGAPLYVAKKKSERKHQRALVQGAPR